MRALVVDPDRRPAFRLAEVPDPQPGPGELLVAVEAASVNRGEVRMAPRREPGTVLGWDVAGRVVAVGAEVTSVTVGERVAALCPGGGSFAELVTVPVDWAVPLPAGDDAVAVSALPVAGITAVGILRAGRVHAGDRVLVTGAAGGVGNLTVQLAAAEGATVTGQAGSTARAAAVRELGAADVLVHAGDGSELSQSHQDAYDVVLDGIGGRMLGPLLRATAPKGRVVLYGNSDERPSEIRVEDLYPKALTVRGFQVFRSVQPGEGAKDLARLCDLLRAGKLRVPVQATAPLDVAVPLLADLLDRKVTGKVVITGSS